MGIEQVFEQSCAKKQRFKSRQAAARRVRDIARTGRIITESNIYHCDFCNGWHLGHSHKIDKILREINGS